MTSENRGPAVADRLSVLERRSRLLLRAYPAIYRRERGEEMIGTLLATTPAGRAWPRLRDIRELAAGGLRARAAQNRSLTARVNIRIAVLAGVSMYLVMIAAAYLGMWVIDPGPLWHEWRVMAVGPLVVVAVLPYLDRAAHGRGVDRPGGNRGDLLRWQGRCAFLVLDLVGGVRRRDSSASAALGAPAANVAMAHRCVRWAVVASRYGSAGPLLQVAPLLALGVVSVAWLAIDARLAVAVATFVLTFYVLPTALFFTAGILPLWLAIVAVAALPVWLMRRQSAPRARSS